MLILEEEYVRVETITGKIVFGYLDVFEEVSDAGTIITPRREEITPVRNSMYFYNVDPLTSEVQKGLDGFYYKDVKSLRTVPALPIDEDFEIDSLEQFFNKRLVNSYVWTRPGSPTVPMDEDVHFSKVFRSAFDRFLCANGAALLARSLDSASPFRKSDLTQL